MNRTPNMATHWQREKIAIPEAERLFIEGRSSESKVLVAMLTRRHTNG